MNIYKSWYVFLKPVSFVFKRFKYYANYFFFELFFQGILQLLCKVLKTLFFYLQTWHYNTIQYNTIRQHDNQ